MSEERNGKCIHSSIFRTMFSTSRKITLLGFLCFRSRMVILKTALFATVYIIIIWVPNNIITTVRVVPVSFRSV